MLRAKHVVVSRKAGNQVYYALRDPVLIQVLDLLKQYFYAHLNDTAGDARAMARAGGVRSDDHRASRAFRGRPGGRSSSNCSPAYDRHAFARGPCSPASRSASSRCRWRWRSASPPASRRRRASTRRSSAGSSSRSLGGSRIQIGGPTGAFVVIVAGIIAAHGLSGLLMVTMMAGVMLVFLAVTGLGQAVKFIPRPVVLGFTNGIALLIASTQIKDFLGLRHRRIRRASSSRAWRRSARRCRTFNPAALALASARWRWSCWCRAWLPRVPGLDRRAGRRHGARSPLFSLPVETIGTQFGGIPSGPAARSHMPAFRADLILPLLPSALTVALLAAVESLLSAVVADSMTGDRHNSNAELLAQGVANLVVAARRRHSRDRRDRADGDELPLGRPHAGRRPRPRADAAGDRAAARAAGDATCRWRRSRRCSFVVAYNMGEWREIAGIWRLELGRQVGLDRSPLR